MLISVLNVLLFGIALGAPIQDKHRAANTPESNDLGTLGHLGLLSHVDQGPVIPYIPNEKIKVLATIQSQHAPCYAGDVLGKAGQQLTCSESSDGTSSTRKRKREAYPMLPKPNLSSLSRYVPKTPIPKFVPKPRPISRLSSNPHANPNSHSKPASNPIQKPSPITPPVAPPARANTGKFLEPPNPKPEVAPKPKPPKPETAPVPLRRVNSAPGKTTNDVPSVEAIGKMINVKKDESIFYSGPQNQGYYKLAKQMRDGMAFENKLLKNTVPRRRLVTETFSGNKPWRDIKDPVLRQKFWDNASEAYAKKSSGTVYVLLPEGKGTVWQKGTVWDRIEWNALRNNPNVEKIIRIGPKFNPKTDRGEVLFERGVTPVRRR